MIILDWARFVRFILSDVFEYPLYLIYAIFTIYSLRLTVKCLLYIYLLLFGYKERQALTRLRLRSAYTTFIALLAFQYQGQSSVKNGPLSLFWVRVNANLFKRLGLDE
jgi:hypothetical protein